MTLDEKLQIETQKMKIKEFDTLVRPLVKYLCENFNPHTQICITNTGAEITEGVMYVPIKDYLKD